jgi:FkbM family methyltransferase
MPLKTLKKAVKSSHFLYQRLLPVLTAFRRSRRQAMINKRDRAINRFREYCVKLSQAVERPVFVKVGANDGIGDDPCSDIFLAHKNWSGVLIEPVPYWFERLKGNFKEVGRFAFEQVAIGFPAGETTFYHVDPKGRERMPGWEDWFDKLGSFDRNHILKHANGVLEPFIVEAKVQVCPLMDIVQRHGIKELHLLHIDAEGYDYEVLKTLDFHKIKPVSIFMEKFHLPEGQKTDLLRFLRGQGYVVYDCVSDYFAMNVEADKRVSAKATA